MKKFITLGPDLDVWDLERQITATNLHSLIRTILIHALEFIIAKLAMSYFYIL